MFVERNADEGFEYYGSNNITSSSSGSSSEAGVVQVEWPVVERPIENRTDSGKCLQNVFHVTRERGGFK